MRFADWGVKRVSPVLSVICERMLQLVFFSKNGRKNSVISCFLQNSFLCLCTVLLYRLTGKLINYYRKPSKLQIVQWRATPSGSFREPVDYKGQEPSNLVFSEFRRSLLCSKTFFYCVVFCILQHNLRLSSKKVWVDKIFAVVMKKRSLVATLCRDDNCAMTSRGNLFNRHR